MGDITKIDGQPSGYGLMAEKISAGAYESYLEPAFERDMAAAYGMTDHPKRKRLWLHCMYHNAAGGFLAILKAYDELIWLVQ